MSWKFVVLDCIRPSLSAHKFFKVAITVSNTFDKVIETGCQLAAANIPARSNNNDLLIAKPTEVKNNIPPMVSASE